MNHRGGRFKQTPSPGTPVMVWIDDQYPSGHRRWRHVVAWWR